MHATTRQLVYTVVGVLSWGYEFTTVQCELVIIYTGLCKLFRVRKGVWLRITVNS